MNIFEDLDTSPALHDVTNVDIHSKESDPTCLSSSRSTVLKVVEGQSLGVRTPVEERDNLSPAEQYVLPRALTVPEVEGLDIGHTLPSPSSSDDHPSVKYPSKTLRKRKSIENPIDSKGKRSKENHTDEHESEYAATGPASDILEPPVWCRRCGCSSTCRWRTGPLGSNSLCNACYLRWRNTAKPFEGYNHTIYPPNGVTPPPQTDSVVKNKRKKATKLMKSRSKPPTPKEIHAKGDIASNEERSNEKRPKKTGVPLNGNRVLTSNCHYCLSAITSLWRKGPLGQRTLCNACGLRWSKFSRLTQLQENSPLVTDAIKKTDEMLAVCTDNSENLPTTHISARSAVRSAAPPILATEKSISESPHTLVRQRKSFLKAGMYSSLYKGYRTAKKKANANSFKFSLPLHQGALMMKITTDFTLPLDIKEEFELGKIGIYSPVIGMKKPAFTQIRANVFVERKPNRSEHNVICQCVRPADGAPGCGEDCLNRLLFYECEPKSCPCEEQCSNQRFQRKEFNKQLQVYATRERGWGLRTMTNIKKNDLLIEYRGEIVSQKTCEERMKTIYKDEKNFYFLDYHNGEVIDACTKGTDARFINHSCEPNCHIEKWALKGELHIGVIASRDIPANTELFYDYNFTWFGNVESQQRCRCGSSNCRGIIGKRPGKREARLLER